MVRSAVGTGLLELDNRMCIQELQYITEPSRAELRTMV